MIIFSDNIRDDQGGLIHRLPKPPKSGNNQKKNQINHTHEYFLKLDIFFYHFCFYNPDRVLLEAWHREEMLSVVMVGHPYTRLVGPQSTNKKLYTT